MSFLHPAFLSALFLAGIPLLIHLLRRRKQKVVKWAAMEFLLVSQKKQQRKLRIEEILLLVLRTLIILLFVFALARPILKNRGMALLSQQSRRPSCRPASST